jgi:hypothetical protein
MFRAGTLRSLQVLTSLAFTVGQFWILAVNFLRRRNGESPLRQIATIDQLPSVAPKLLPTLPNMIRVFWSAPAKNLCRFQPEMHAPVLCGGSTA